ncbi:hypothetical protein [Brevibacterium marinum]|uniref:5,10-methylene-tetrahydrofolate dehydrogenase/Methenyl tetrahydrofolate cyclohydrolase n=1 Tax=Brevibacterium marinum TaxID=418643 RepID=A0A846RYY5_9MICO|nr:hypothetical protein [Brevibacterium marinum]NJC56370.1 hypothetical protein [Brevibacterium marinum]
MGSEAKVIGLIADSGVPEKIAQSVAGALKQELAERVEDVEWNVVVSKDTFSLTPDGDIPLMDRAQETRRQYEWDYTVYLTDLPRHHNREPLLCEVSTAQQALLVSVPALGAHRLRAQTRKLVVALIYSTEEGTGQTSLAESVRSIAQLKSAHGDAQQGRNDTSYIVLPGWPNRLRLLTGMVRSNRPGRMLPALTTSIAAAAAVGTFGVFYSSIWTLADSLHPVRLLVIGLLVVAALTFWLIFRNRLWTRRRDAVYAWQGGLDNTTTIIMVGTSVALMFLVLFAFLLGLGLVVVDASRLHSELMHPVSFFSYPKLAWLAACLGTLAGALGSNFDSDDEIRQATYSKREYERRQRREAYDDAESD